MEKLFLQLIYSSLLCLFVNSIAYAQPAYDSNGQATGQAGANFLTISSFSVPAGNNKLLIVCVTSTSTSSATFDGNSMTHAVQVINSGLRVTFYTYKLGNSGTATVGDIVVSGSNIISAGAKSYHNVDQTTPIDNATSSLGNATTTSLSVTSATNDLACDCLGGFDFTGPYTFTANVSQTQLYHDAAGTTGGAMVTIGSSQEAGAASVSMDWIMSGTVVFGHLGMNINSAGVLPVELTNFQAATYQEQVLLEWETATERINKGFEIERSTDGKEWKNIGFVNGHGTTTEAQEYSFSDYAPILGQSYYRLKQIDDDGAFEYSDVVTVDYKNGIQQVKMQLFPNPVVNELHITVGQGQATIYNGSGQLIRTFNIAQSPFKINTSDLPKGQYILSIQRENGNVMTKQFIK